MIVSVVFLVNISNSYNIGGVVVGFFVAVSFDFVCLLFFKNICFRSLGLIHFQ